MPNLYADRDTITVSTFSRWADDAGVQTVGALGTALSATSPILKLDSTNFNFADRPNIWELVASLQGDFTIGYTSSSLNKYWYGVRLRISDLTWTVVPGVRYALLLHVVDNGLFLSSTSLDIFYELPLEPDAANPVYIELPIATEWYTTHTAPFQQGVLPGRPLAPFGVQAPFIGNNNYEFQLQVYGRRDRMGTGTFVPTLRGAFWIETIGGWLAYEQPSLCLPPHLLSSLNPIACGNTSPRINVAFPNYVDGVTAPTGVTLYRKDGMPDVVELQVRRTNTRGPLGRPDVAHIVRPFSDLDKTFVLVDQPLTPGLPLTLDSRVGDLAANRFEEYKWSQWGAAVTYAKTPELPPAPIISAVVDTGNNEVDLTLTSLGNLLPAHFTWNLFSSPGTGATGEYTALTAGASTTSDWLARVATSGTDPFVDRMERTIQLQRVTTNGLASASTDFIPVVAGATYAGRFDTSRTAGTVPNNHSMQIDWYDSSFALLSSSAVCVVAVDTLNAPFSASGTVVAPANAAWAKIRLEGNTASTAGFCQFGNVVFRRHDASLAASTIVPGGYVWGNALQHLGRLQGPSGNGVVFRYDTMDATGTHYVSAADNASAARTGTEGLRLTQTAIAASTLAFHTTEIRDLNSMILPERLPAGTQFTLSAWLRSAAYTDSAAIGIRFYRTDETPLPYGTYISTPEALTGSFNQHSLVATVPEGAARYSILVLTPQVNAASTVDVDDWQLLFHQATEVTWYNSTVGMLGRPISHPGAWFALERRVGTDGNWAIIAMLPVPPLTQQTTYADKMLPQGTTFYYRATLYGMLQGQLIPGTTSVEATATTSAPSGSNTGRWTLWDPADLTNGPLYFDHPSGTSDGLKYKLGADDAVFKPIGKNRPVVVSDTSKGRTFDLRVESVSSTERDRWLLIHSTRRVVFLRTWDSKWYSVQMLGDIDVSELNTNPALFNLRFTMEQVDVPSVW